MQTYKTIAFHEAGHVVADLLSWHVPSIAMIEQNDYALGSAGQLDGDEC